MHNQFRLRVGSLEIGSSEALYQMLRFTGHPEAFYAVAQAKTPMASKYVAKDYIKHTRTDWMESNDTPFGYRIHAMRLALLVKLSQHYQYFMDLFAKTKGKQIVELSMSDDFWGAIPDGKGNLVGQNILGRLWMELRELTLTATQEEIVERTKQCEAELLESFPEPENNLLL